MTRAAMESTEVGRRAKRLTIIGDTIHVIAELHAFSGDIVTGCNDFFPLEGLPIIRGYESVEACQRDMSRFRTVAVCNVCINGRK